MVASQIFASIGRREYFALAQDIDLMPHTVLMRVLLRAFYIWAFRLP